MDCEDAWISSAREVYEGLNEKWPGITTMFSGVSNMLDVIQHVFNQGYKKGQEDK